MSRKLEGLVGGSAGRDGEDSVVTIFSEPVGKQASKQMREYLNMASTSYIYIFG